VVCARRAARLSGKEIVVNAIDARHVHAGADPVAAEELRLTSHEVGQLATVAGSIGVGDVMAGDIQRPLEREQARDAGVQEIRHDFTGKAVASDSSVPRNYHRGYNRRSPPLPSFVGESAANLRESADEALVRARTSSAMATSFRA